MTDGGNAGEADLLYSSYHNSLTLAAKHGLRSVAFPSISTGVYSYPIKEAAQIAVKAVKDFSKSNPGAIDKVFWVLRDDNTFNAYSDAIGKETASYGVSDIKIIGITQRTTMGRKLVVSRVMRKFICRLWPNEVSLQ